MASTRSAASLPVGLPPGSSTVTWIGVVRGSVAPMLRSIPARIAASAASRVGCASSGRSTDATVNALAAVRASEHGLEGCSLPDVLAAAELQTRVDRKYLLTPEAFTELVDSMRP